MDSSSAETRPVALVLGAGAQGLACALRLWECGWQVTLVARDWLADTTSSGAGAIWEYPPFQVQPQTLAKQWVLESLPAFAAALEAAGSGASGIRLRRSYYLFRSRAKAQDLYGPLEAWCSQVPHFREDVRPPALARAGTFAYCFSYVAPVINMKRYLPWLTHVLGTLPGVRFKQAVLADLADVAALAREARADVVVNCLGLGAGLVFGDAAMYGVRGDLVYVLAPGAEVHHDFAHVSDEDDPSEAITYAVSQGDGVIALAGTAERLAPEALEKGYRPQVNIAADAEIARQILARTLAAIPGAIFPPGSAAGQTVEPLIVGRWSGARPMREGGVRLESEMLSLPGGEGLRLPVVHNYGHGGSGVVTSWGCAVEVVKQAADLLAALDGAGGRRGGLRPQRLPHDLVPFSMANVQACGAAALARDSHLPQPTANNVVARL